MPGSVEGQPSAGPVVSLDAWNVRLDVEAAGERWALQDSGRILGDFATVNFDRSCFAPRFVPTPRGRHGRPRW